MELEALLCRQLDRIVGRFSMMLERVALGADSAETYKSRPTRIQCSVFVIFCCASTSKAAFPVHVLYKVKCTVVL